MAMFTNNGPKEEDITVGTFAEQLPKQENYKNGFSDGKPKGLQITRGSDVFDVLTEKARSMKTSPENLRDSHQHKMFVLWDNRKYMY